MYTGEKYVVVIQKMVVLVLSSVPVLWQYNSYLKEGQKYTAQMSLQAGNPLVFQKYEMKTMLTCEDQSQQSP